MPRVGPWIQDPDYSIATSRNHSSGAQTARRAPMMIANGLPFSNLQKSARMMTYGSEWVPVGDGADVFAAALGSSITAISEPFNPSMRSSQITRVHEAGVIGSDDWGSGAEAVLDLFPWYVPVGVSSASQLGWSPFYYEPAEAPPGAVAVEYESDNDISEALAVRLLATTRMRADNIDESGTGAGDDYSLTSVPPTSIYVQRVDEVGAPDGRSFVATYADSTATGPATAVGPLGVDVDLTSALGTEGFIVSTESGAFVGPRWPDEPTLFNPSNRWQFGFYIDRLDIGWTLRPPRYRWIYDTAPIRRTFPRDDALAGGAARTWPTPTSLQESNRTFGSYL